MKTRTLPWWVWLIPVGGGFLYAYAPVWLAGIYMGLCLLGIALGALSIVGEVLTKLYYGITDRSVSVYVIPEKPKDPTAPTDYSIIDIPARRVK